MPRKPMPWFRVYVEIVNDPKIRRRTPTQRWLWISILAAARRSPIPGYLMVTTTDPMTTEDLADFSGVMARDVRSALPLFEKSEMIEWDPALGAWCVTNFASRQFASDDVTERTRKYRGKERDGNVPTPPDGTTLERSRRARRNDLGTDQSRDRAETETDPHEMTTSSSRVPVDGVEDLGLTSQAVWAEWAEARRLRNHDKEAS